MFGRILARIDFVVTPLEVLSVMQRVGYVRNDGPLNDPVALQSGSVSSSVQSSVVPQAAVFTVPSANEEDDDLFASDSDEQTSSAPTSLSGDDDLAATDSQFENGTDWLSIV